MSEFDILNDKMQLLIAVGSTSSNNVVIDKGTT